MRVSAEPTSHAQTRRKSDQCLQGQRICAVAESRRRLRGTQYACAGLSPPTHTHTTCACAESPLLWRLSREVWRGTGQRAAAAAAAVARRGGPRPGSGPSPCQGWCSSAVAGPSPAMTWSSRGSSSCSCECCGESGGL